MRPMFPAMPALLLAGLCSATVLSVPPAMAEEHRLTIESGEVSGMYYPEAGAICRVVNKDTPRHGVHCLVDPTAGSAANLQALGKGVGDMAIVQSGVLAQAVSGTGPFAKSPMPGLRSLFSLHGESVALVLGPDTRIKTVADLKGKRVALGAAGSFQRLMADALMFAEGLQTGDFAPAIDLELPRLAQALCHNEIDAAIVAGLHPIAEVQDAMDDCEARLLPLKDAALDAYLKNNPAFAHQVIPETAYGGQQGKTASFGVSAVMVATDRLAQADGYEVVKAVFESLAPLKAMHPRFTELDRKQMSREALVAPLHEGALQYYKEAGLR